MRKKAGFFIFLFLFCGLVFLAIMVYLFFVSNTKSEKTVQISIPRHASYEQVLDTLSAHQILQHEITFKVAVKVMRFKTMRAGKYNIKPDMNNYQLVKLLRKGQHFPVTFSFTGVRTLDKFVDKVDHRFLFNPEELLALLHDTVFLSKYNLTEATCPAIFIPNTYQIYYDVTAEEFFNRMHRNYQQFWTGRRKEEAKAIGLTPTEIATLASIVEEENHHSEEWAIIAGLYINRLKKGMLLQSDPTVKFALGDFSRQRILNADLRIDSPYNTYLYPGLPPGPIRLPDQAAIDSVLHYRHHSYLYMCAKEDLSGYHHFTANDAIHKKNAQLYRAALQAHHIKK